MLQVHENVDFCKYMSVKRNVSVLQSNAVLHRTKMNHIWIQTSFNTPYEAHLKTQRFAWVKIEKNAVKSQDFLKIT